MANTHLLRYQTVDTAYTVQTTDRCDTPTGSFPFIMYSPNKNQSKPIAKQFYCVNGPCRSKGENYWDRTGPAGGPEVLDASATQVLEFNKEFNTTWFVEDEFDGAISAGLKPLPS
jgi:hypothetical protein